MNDKNTWGGKRAGATPPRKMSDPLRVTITIERKDLNQLRAKFGRGWQDKIREAIQDLLLKGD